MATVNSEAIRPALSGVCANCLELALRDEPWQNFGFQRSPSYLWLFRRFRAAWKVELERRLAREMLVAFTSAHLAAGVVALDEIDAIVTAYADQPEVIAELGYRSVEEAVENLTGSIRQYARTPPANWGALITDRVNPHSIPDKRVSERVFDGCLQFACNVTNLVRTLRPASLRRNGAR